MLAPALELVELLNWKGSRGRDSDTSWANERKERPARRKDGNNIFQT
jgi:hypothetical protein